MCRLPFFYRGDKMELKLYVFNGSINEINKELSNETVFNIRLKKQTDQLHGIIQLKSETDLTHFNYARIDVFNRFYFIEEVEPKTNTLFVLRLKVDVLESFKEDILKSVGRITASEKIGYANQNIETDIRRITEKHVGTYKGVPHEKHYILTTLGG